MRMLLSISSQVEGAARIDAGEPARAAAMAPLARACANLLQLAIAGNANGDPPTLLQLVGALPRPQAGLRTDLRTVSRRPEAGAQSLADTRRRLSAWSLRPIIAPMGNDQVCPRAADR